VSQKLSVPGQYELLPGNFPVCRGSRSIILLLCSQSSQKDVLKTLQIMQDYKLDNWTFIANKTMHAHINQVICEFVATY